MMAAIISMRLLVVAGSPPDSSRSRFPIRRMAPQPPGPGFPLHAPSVKISTSALLTGPSSQAVVRDRTGAAMKAQLGEVLLRILALDQGIGRRVHPVVEAGQQEAQRRPARQQRQQRAFVLAERPHSLVALQQRASLGGVERLVSLEAPGIEADRHVVGEGVV